MKQKTRTITIEENAGSDSLVKDLYELTYHPANLFRYTSEQIAEGLSKRDQKVRQNWYLTGSCLSAALGAEDSNHAIRNHLTNMHRVFERMLKNEPLYLLPEKEVQVAQYLLDVLRN